MAGDLLAVAMVVLSALAFVRALVAPVFLGTEADEVLVKTRLAVLVLGLVVAAGAFPAADARSTPSTGAASRRVPASPDWSHCSGRVCRADPPRCSEPVGIAGGVIAGAVLLALTLAPIWLGESSASSGRRSWRSSRGRCSSGC